MILVDDRAGSKELFKYFIHCDAHLVRQPYGDIAFLGEGPDGDLIPVGIEVKTVGDVLNCISDGRFAGHQLLGLRRHYSIIFLIAQGDFRADKWGVLCVPRKGGLKPVTKGGKSFMWRDFHSWLFTMEMLGGVKVRLTRNERETGMLCLALYRWFTGKTWEEHHAHQAFDKSHRHPLMGEFNLVTRMAKELDKVGWDRAQKVGARFKTVKEMVEASEVDWESIEGIGKKIARMAVKDLKGGTNESDMEVSSVHGDE